MYPHFDDLRSVYFYGKQNHLSAVTTNSMKSSEFTIEAIKKIDPDLIILGGMDDNEMRFCLGEQPTLNNAGTDAMFCKKQFSKFIDEVEPKSDDFYYHSADRILYVVDEETRAIEAHDYLTAGIMSLEIETCRLMFGKPNSLLVLEDLIINYPLG